DSEKQSVKETEINRAIFGESIETGGKLGCEPDIMMVPLSGHLCQYAGSAGRVEVFGIVRGSSVPVNLDSPQICGHVQPNCPLESGQWYTYTKGMFIDYSYPAMQLNVRWVLKDSQDDMLLIAFCLNERNFKVTDHHRFEFCYRFTRGSKDHVRYHTCTHGCSGNEDLVIGWVLGIKSAHLEHEPPTSLQFRFPIPIPPGFKESTRSHAVLSRNSRLVS
ncbi:Niemann-Pick C2 protein, partial [Clonorchis sinensis]